MVWFIEKRPYNFPPILTELGSIIFVLANFGCFPWKITQKSSFEISMKNLDLKPLCRNCLGNPFSYELRSHPSRPLACWNSRRLYWDGNLGISDLSSLFICLRYFQCDQMPGIFPKTLTWKSPAGIFIFCLCSKSGIFEKFNISKFSWNFAKFLSKKKTVFFSFVFCKLLLIFKRKI